MRFDVQGLALGCRLDGRGLHEFRKVRFEFALDDTSATVTLGSTRVLATISAELEAPFPDRASEVCAGAATGAPAPDGQAQHDHHFGGHNARLPRGAGHPALQRGVRAHGFPGV